MDKIVMTQAEEWRALAEELEHSAGNLDRQAYGDVADMQFNAAAALRQAAALAEEREREERLLAFKPWNAKP